MPPFPSAYYMDDGQLASRLTVRALPVGDTLLEGHDNNRVVVTVALFVVAAGQEGQISLHEPGSAFQTNIPATFPITVSAHRTFDIDDVGGIVKSEVWVRNTAAIGSLFALVYSTLCPLRHIRQPCDPMSTFDYRTLEFDPTPLSVITAGFQGNTRRVAFSVSVDNPGDVAGRVLELLWRTGSGAIWYRRATPFNETFPYRDWGPIVKEPVFFISNHATARLVLTETWLIRQ